MKSEHDLLFTRDFMSKITDFSLYLETLLEIKNENILFLTAVRDTVGFYFSDRHNILWKRLGFKSTLLNKHWNGYLAVTDFKNITHEDLGEDNKSVFFETDVDPLTHISMFSSPWTDQNTAEIKINEEEYCDNFRGFNIVLYDLSLHTFIDVASFDTHTPEIVRLKRDAIHPVGKIIERLKINNILPQNKSCDGINDFFTTEPEKQEPLSYSEKKYGVTKIEVRIIFFGFAGIWNCIRSLALEFAKDEKYHLVVIVCYDTDGQASKLQVVANDGLEFIDVRDYDFDLDKVDIWITNAWNDRVFDDINFASRTDRKLFITLNPTLINGGMPAYEFFEQLRLLSDISDFVIISELIYDTLKNKKELIENVVPMKLPQFDSFYEKIYSNSESYQNILNDNPNSHKNRSIDRLAQQEKLSGKKVILWVTDHVWDTKNVTFDLYIKDIIQFFRQHDDLGLIIRPHNMYIRELLYDKIWSPFDLENIRKYFYNSTNIIWDESQDIAIAYSLADAVISDVNCGLSVSALVIDKPLAVLYRNDGNECIPINKDVASNLYELKNLTDFENFVEMAAAGKEDETKIAARHSLFKKYIGSFDGKNGARIKAFIEREYLKK